MVRRLFCIIRDFLDLLAWLTYKQWELPGRFLRDPKCGCVTRGVTFKGVSRTSGASGTLCYA
jgi:hypothetical protein